MTSLFHFEDKVHRRNLTQAESTPLLFPRLLCQVLEHIGFHAEPRIKHRRDCEVVLTIDRWQIMPRSYHLSPPNPAEDQPTIDLPIEERPSPAMHAKEPQIPASSIPAPATTAPLPIAPASSVPPKPTAHTDLAGPSSSAPPSQHITISTRDFLAIMDAVCTFSVTSASFAAAHAALAEKMTHTEATLAQNQAILMQIQSHLGLPQISPSVPAQASSVHPPSIPAPSAQPAPIAPLDLLVASVAVAAPPPATPAAPQPAQDEDDLPPATH